jgi:hypothetical protein
VPRFILYSLLCCVSFMMFSSFSFAFFVTGYARTLIIFVCVCFLHIVNSSFDFLRCTVRSKK